MSNDKREPDNTEPAAPLALNKETLGDLDVEAEDAYGVKGGAPSTIACMLPSHTKAGAALNKLQ